jgi:peptide deformylase
VTAPRRILNESTDCTEHYEGCLSFFDVRGLVPRARSIEVEHQTLDGAKRIVCFEDGVARLAAHEIDHLNEMLYTDRMTPGTAPIPVDEYKNAGQLWEYS